MEREDFERLPNERNNSSPVINITSPAMHKTKRSECSLSNVCVCGAQD